MTSKFFIATCVLMASLTACRTSSPNGATAELNEFEDATDICQSIRNAAQQRFRPGPGLSISDVFQRLKSTDSHIIEDLVTSYRAKKTHLAAISAKGVVEPGEGDSTGPERELTPDAGVSATDDQGVCANCSVEEVEHKIAFYVAQKKALSDCTLRPGAAQVRTPKVEQDWRRLLLEYVKGTATSEDICNVVGKMVVGDSGEAADSCKTQTLKFGCGRVLGKSSASQNTDIIADSELKAAAVACISETAGPVVADVADASISAAQKAYLEGKDAKTIFALAACEGGANLVGHTLSVTPQVEFENACSALNPLSRSFQGKSRMVSCLRTGKDVCEIFLSTGKLDVEKLVSSGDSITEKTARQVLRAADQKLCTASGEVTLACNVIRKASEQIRDAIKTGNNDWAHCLGTDQLGACIGTVWGQRGWSNNSGVAQAVKEGELVYRPCCWCYKDHFIDDNWVTADTRIKRDNWFGVIQDGDVASGNCKFQEKVDGQSDLGEVYRGKKTYARYSDCGKWFVRGDRCAAPAGFRQQVWDAKNKRWIQVTVD